MASSSNRSPSPILSRTNPIPRTLENGNGIRKSFSGHPLSRPLITAAPRSFNPATPANSPSDFPHKNFGSKDGRRASFDQKENERDRNSLNSIRLKSPVISKGTKNFMAPTISAASKFTASPKKKVLAERNEPVRTSTSDVKSPLPSMTFIKSSEDEDIGSKSESDLGSQVTLDTPQIPENLSKPRSIDLDSREHLGASCLPDLISKEFSETKTITSETITSISDCPKAPEVLSHPRNIDFECNEQVCSSLRVSDSSDIDPSLPPYDPKTNYLSPRPKFLHYKPNPRIEVFLNKEKGFDPGEGKTLEDSFTSESCSDSEQIEETHSLKGKNLEDSFTSESYSDSEQIEETQSPNSETNSSNACSSELKAENDEEPHVSEPKSDSCNSHSETPLEDTVIKANEIPRKSSRSCTRPKFVSFLLVLAITCLSFSVTDSPVSSSISTFNDDLFPTTYVLAPSVLKELYLSDPFPKIAEFVGANIEWVSYNFRHWSLSSISYLSGMTYFPRKGESALFHFMNLTDSNTDISVSKLPSDMTQIEDIGEKQIKSNEEGTSSAVEQLGLDTHETIHEELIEETGDTVVEPTIHEMDHESKQAVKEQLGLETQEAIHEEIGDSVVEEPDSYGEVSEEQIKIIEPAIYKVVTEEPGNKVLREQNKIMEEQEVQEKCDTDGHTIVEDSAQYLESDAETYGSLETIDSIVEDSAQYLESDAETQGSLETIDSIVHVPEDDFLLRIEFRIFSLLVTVVAVVATSLHLKKRNAFVPKVEVLKQPNSPKKMPSNSVSASTESKPYMGRSSSFNRNWPAVVEVVAESAPSEMSSSSLDKDSSCSQRGPKDRKEMNSSDGKLRRNSNRDSMVSSSEYSAGSPSYGSFTTYEKLSSKQGNGDDDAMTPVRRSSRLRKQITSP